MKVGAAFGLLCLSVVLAGATLGRAGAPDAPLVAYSRGATVYEGGIAGGARPVAHGRFQDFVFSQSGGLYLSRGDGNDCDLYSQSGQLLVALKSINSRRLTTAMAYVI